MVRLYRMLLRLYPRAFREEFGHEMELLMRDRLREESGRFGRIGLFRRCATDFFVSFSREWTDTLRSGRAHRRVSPIRDAQLMNSVLYDLRFAFRKFHFTIGAIMNEVRDRTDGKVELGAGTLYGTIKRLVIRRLVKEAAEHSVSETNAERRKYYRLTNLGRKIAVAEAQRLTKLVHDARAKSLIPQSS